MARKRHPVKEIEAAARYAESNGWTVMASGSSAHSWAKAPVPGGLPATLGLVDAFQPGRPRPPGACVR